MARPCSSLRHQLYCRLLKGTSWLSMWSCPYFPPHFPILCISNRESLCLLWKYLLCVFSTFFPTSPPGMGAPGEQGLCLSCSQLCLQWLVRRLMQSRAPQMFLNEYSSIPPSSYALEPVAHQPMIMLRKGPPIFFTGSQERFLSWSITSERILLMAFKYLLKIYK